VLFMSVAPLLEPLLEVLDMPPEEVLPPLEVLDMPPEEEVVVLPPELVELPELPELLAVFELLLEPPELVPLDVPVFKPGPELLPLPDDAAPASLVEVPLLLPRVLLEKGPVESSPMAVVPAPLAQPGAHPTAPTSKANMHPDSLRSNRFTATPCLRREEAAQ
jgi:hypothetical protein